MDQGREKTLPTNFHPTRKALKLASLLVLEYVSFRVWFISTQFGLLYRIHILTPSFVNALSTLSFHASTEPPSSPFFLVHLVLLRYDDKLYHEIN